MKSLIILLLSFFTSAAAEASSLEQSDLVATWTNSNDVSPGEITTLEIDSEMNAIFTRRFQEYPDQRFMAKLVNVDGIWIGDFDSTKQFGYKLVLSGWKLESSSMLFGTMFMYKKAELFNGVSISFSKGS